ncbi:MAG TPA: hypothetical protein VHF89_11860 [Solirubrobacteraceae bacterium]|nr:hypothetical protein [Solirubrobacteraceae bacterium]
MDFQMIPVLERIEVEGCSDRDAVGEFSGRVIAVAFQGGDPVGDPVGDLTREQEDAASAPPEGLGGWGTTFFLVADDKHPSPIWVPKDDVEKTKLG